MASGGQLRLKVLRIGGDCLEVDVPETATVEELKRQLVDLARLPFERQRLIFRGRALDNGLRLSEAGVENGHTLHLVEQAPPSRQQQAQQAQQQGAGAPPAGAGGMGFDFLGGLLNGLGVNAAGAPQGVGVMPGPSGMQGGRIVGPFMMAGDPGAPGAAGNMGMTFAQEMMAAFGGGGMLPGQQPEAPPSGGPAISLRMPALPAPRMGHPDGGPSHYPHLLTGLNLMMTRMEHEGHDPVLDPLPRIRENYGRPSGAEILYFLRAARTLLNSSPLLRPTRAAVDRVLEAAGLPSLRPLPWQRDEGNDDDDYADYDDGDDHRPSEGSWTDEESEGARRRAVQWQAALSESMAGGSVRSGSAAGGPRSFPVPANESSEDEGEGGERRRGGRRRGGGRVARPAAGHQGVAGASIPAAAGEGPPPLETDSERDEHEERPPPLASGEDEETEEEEYTEEEDDEEEAQASSIPSEDLLLVAAVCLGELSSRFLDLAGANGDDALWDLADELRSLRRVRRGDYPRLAGSVQQLTARMYRLGSMWAELSRGMQYLGAALERGNMAVVSAIPGFLTVHGSQAIPNLQRPGFPPHAYLGPSSGYFAGQIPDSNHWHGAMALPAAVVDVAVGPFPPGAASGDVAGQPAAGAQAQQPPAAAASAGQQPQLGAQQAARQASLIGNFVGNAIAGAAGLLNPPAPAAAAAQPGGAQARQQPGRQGGSQQALRAVDALVASTRTGLEQASQRVQDARYAMQAVVAGGEGGPQMVLQRAHQAMQSMVAAEEAMARARQRSEQASQQLQRLLRAQQGPQQGQQAQQPGQPQVIHQAVRITLGPGGRTVVGPAGAGAAGQQPQQQGGAQQGAAQQGRVQQAQQGAAQQGRAQQAQQGAEQQGADFMAAAQEILAGIGMAPATQQGLLQQLGGMAQALRQSSLAALDLPAVLADVRSALSAALREVAQQAQQQQGSGAGVGSGAGTDNAALAEAAVPRLTAAVGAVLERHMARLAESPALRQFMPYLEQMGIHLPAAAAGAPASAAGATSAPAAEAVGAPATAPTPATTAAPASSTEQASVAATQAAAAAPEATQPSQAAGVATPAPPAAPAAVQQPQEEATLASAAAASSGAASASGSQPAASASRGDSKPKTPAGLGLGKGLGRPAAKKRAPSVGVEGLKAGDASSLGEGVLQAVAAAAGDKDSAGEGRTAPPALPADISAAIPAAASEDVAPKRQDRAAAAEAAPDATPIVPAAAAQETALASIPPRPPAPRSLPAGPGGDLAGLLGGLLGGGGPGGASGGAGGGGGGGLLGMMSSVMQSPAFMQMAQSPAMQQMAERMLGGSGGGGLDTGLMSELMGGMLGGRPGLQARGMEGGAAGGSRNAPADLDSALSVLPPEDAARWKGIIEADAKRQAQATAQSSEGSGGFSDAYSALRLAGRGTSRSGLLSMLAGGGDSEEGEDDEEE